jgi:hypothetical protein
LLLACCAAACGNDDDRSVACEPAAIETIISRPGLSPFGLELVLSPGCARHIAYDLDDGIFVIDDHGGWSEPTLVTADVEGIHGQPSMVESEGMLHLVWRRQRGVESVEPSELLHSTRAEGGGEWTEPFSLTGEFDSAESHSAYHPQLTRASDGEQRFAYSSQYDSPDTVDAPPPPESRVIGVDGGAPAGPPVTVLPAFLSGGCMEPRAQFDGDSALHVVSSCSLLDTGSAQASPASTTLSGPSERGMSRLPCPTTRPGKRLSLPAAQAAPCTWPGSRCAPDTIPPISPLI